MAPRNAESYRPYDNDARYQDSDPRVASADRELAGELAAAMEDHRTDPATDPAEASHTARDLLLWKAAWRQEASEMGDPHSEENFYAAEDRRAMGFALESTQTADQQISDLRHLLHDPQAADEDTKRLTTAFTEHHGEDWGHELKIRLDYAEAVKNTGRQLVYEGLSQNDDEASAHGLAMIRSAEYGLQEALEDPAGAGTQLGRPAEQLQYDASRLNEYQNANGTAASHLINEAGITDPLTQHTVDTVMTRHAAAIAAYGAYEKVTGYLKGNMTEGSLQDAMLQLSAQIDPDSYIDNHATGYVRASTADVAAMKAHGDATTQYFGLAQAGAENQKDLDSQAHHASHEAAAALFNGNGEPLQGLIGEMTDRWGSYQGRLSASIADSLNAKAMRAGHQAEDYRQEVASGTDPHEAYQLHGVDLERTVAGLAALNGAARIFELHLSTAGRTQQARHE